MTQHLKNLNLNLKYKIILHNMFLIQPVIKRLQTRNNSLLEIDKDSSFAFFYYHQQ